MPAPSRDIPVWNHPVDKSETPHLSVIIPAFNESERIVSTLNSVAAYLGAQSYSWEILVVDDGSSDDTAYLVNSTARDISGIRLLRREHFGKGWAVRAGMLEARGRYRFMCDADLAMPIEWLDRFLENMSVGMDIVIGSREIAGAMRLDEPRYRHVMGRVFNWVVRAVAVRGFQDTQCGFKCFSEDAAHELFSRQRARRMGFDAEILYLAIKMGYSVIEIPVEWRHQEGSKVRPGADSIDMLKDALLIRLRDISGRYRRKTKSLPTDRDRRGQSE